jgi:hypothetical protein
VFWWLKSRSDKTGEGNTEWMIPEATVKALRTMDRWAKPYQAMIEVEIVALRADNPNDPVIAEAKRHQRAVFLSESCAHRNKVRTLSDRACNHQLNLFAKKVGLNWNLTTHQFRRTFANYAARSQFGDLRYLREHFKHWSMDMTLGYAMNESQEMALYLDIQDELDDIKIGVVEQWLAKDTLLAGGFGENIVEWRGSNPVTLFKDHAAMLRSLADSISIRSSLHAWCTANDGQCVGLGSIDPLRCTDCDNAVISQQHAHIYQRQFMELETLMGCADDIGESGINRVKRDLERCSAALSKLGVDAISLQTAVVV